MTINRFRQGSRELGHPWRESAWRNRGYGSAPTRSLAHSGDVPASMVVIQQRELFNGCAGIHQSVNPYIRADVAGIKSTNIPDNWFCGVIDHLAPLVDLVDHELGCESDERDYESKDSHDATKCGKRSAP